MKSAIVKIWLRGDASFEYTKKFNGNDATAHLRFIRDAEKKFPNFRRIKVVSV